MEKPVDELLEFTANVCAYYEIVLYLTLYRAVLWTWMGLKYRMSTERIHRSDLVSCEQESY